MSGGFDQAEFLRRKKEEILAKKKSKATDVEKTPTIDTKPGHVPFANDGSFLEKFKAMQKQNVQQVKKEPVGDIEQNFSNKPISSSTSSSLTTQKRNPLQKPASVFVKEEPCNDTGQVTSNNTAACESDYEFARELAEKVHKEGIQAEMMARIQGRNNPRYQFLFDTSNPVACFYQTQLNNLKRSANQPSPAPTIPPSATQSSAASSSSTPVGFMSEFEKAKAMVRAKAAAMKEGGVASATAAAKVLSEQEIKREKEKEEQKMMNEIYMKVIQQQMSAATQQTKRKRKRDPDKPKYEYDSDEDTEGGTWEHKKRQSEMQKTAEKALELTDNAKGKHHISDFLPPDELEKFLEKVKAVKEGREADFSDYAKFKINEENVGYKMLMKAGWQEGTGLGSKGEGITAPINKGKTSFDQGGLGTEKVAEVKKEDDDFDVYRKRMMLAYKFRPNPLNNPRRPYYE